MGTEIFKIDASWTEKLTKTRGSQRLLRQLYLGGLKSVFEVSQPVQAG